MKCLSWPTVSLSPTSSFEIRDVDLSALVLHTKQVVFLLTLGRSDLVQGFEYVKSSDIRDLVVFPQTQLYRW